MDNLIFLFDCQTTDIYQSTGTFTVNTKLHITGVT